MGELANPGDHVVAIAALRTKRADIAGEIAKLESDADRLRTTLVHVDAVLRLFRPDIEPETIPMRQRRPAKSPYFKHGELTQRIYEALRATDAVVSSGIAVIAMRDKGLDPDHDPVTRRDFVHRVTLQLNDMHRKGKLEKIGKGPGLRWKLATV
jgi:hypothetical protein